jgi:1-deoxy-D-xylulose-5-phosphate reductoisomerase
VKRIAILGSTGSIGCSTLSVVAAHPERLEVVGLAAGGNVQRFVHQVQRYRPRIVGMVSETAVSDVRQALQGTDAGPMTFAAPGDEGLREIATHPDVDLVVCATSGTAALHAVLSAIEAGKTIALANKEVLVMAGALMMQTARAHNIAILPVDSEHNAIHQCLHGRVEAEVERLILTASGGPFRDWTEDQLKRVTPSEALKHPTWNMGRKITIDSSTLMNKGLEVIEARWLFDVGPERIDVVVHPQSVVHSLVELRDGSVIAQLGVTDMRLPIQYALSYPERWRTELPTLDLAACGQLDFDRPDTERFPCLGLAYRALQGRSTAPIVLNAANEVAVEAFLDGRLDFPGIPRVIEQSLDAAEREGWPDVESLAAIREVDTWARRFSHQLLKGVESK